MNLSRVGRIIAGGLAACAIAGGPLAYAAPTPSPTASATRAVVSSTPTPASTPTPTRAPAVARTAAAVPAPVDPTYARPGGVFTVSGPILDKYTALGRERGQLGFPTSNAWVAGRGVSVQRFEGGNIYWRADVGATYIVGENLATYGRHGWENGFADVLTAGEFRSADGRSYLNWARGGDGTTIIWNPVTGSHETHGAIRQKWHASGAEFTFGAPSTDEFVGNDSRSRLNFFKTASGEEKTIIWNPGTGTHAVFGAIREQWHAQGAEGGPLGAPTSDEFAPARRDLRVQLFARGMVVWGPATGAHTVRGAMLTEFSRRGYEGGDLGAPISNEWRFSNGWAQDFENGRLLLVDGQGPRTQVRVNAYVRQAAAGDAQRTFHAGCPVGPDQLRVVEMNHLGYDGRVKRGMMVLRADAVDRTVRAFSTAAWDSFPIEKMINPDVWGNDPDQMAANNTSGFFCRSVVGNPYAMSPHSYGRAVDINTVQNPYFDGSRWWPSNGMAWIDRGRRDQGMLFDGVGMTRAMTDNGYFWGGWWASKDYQHFQVN